MQKQHATDGIYQLAMTYRYATWPSVHGCGHSHQYACYQLAMFLAGHLVSIVGVKPDNTQVSFPSLSRQTQSKCGHADFWVALRCP